MNVDGQNKRITVRGLNGLNQTGRLDDRADSFPKPERFRWIWERDRPGRPGRPTRQRPPNNLFRSLAGQSYHESANTIRCRTEEQEGFRRDADGGGRDDRISQEVFKERQRLILRAEKDQTTPTSSANLRYKVATLTPSISAAFSLSPPVWARARLT